MSDIQDIIVFLEDELSIKKGSIKENSKIEDDLGCTGDDAIELFELFSKKYEISTDGINFNDFLLDEEFNPIKILFNFIKGRKDERKRILTVRDLFDVANAKTWAVVNI